MRARARAHRAKLRADRQLLPDPRRNTSPSTEVSHSSERGISAAKSVLSLVRIRYFPAIRESLVPRRANIGRSAKWPPNYFGGAAGDRAPRYYCRAEITVVYATQYLSFVQAIRARPYRAQSRPPPDATNTPARTLFFFLFR